MTDTTETPVTIRLPRFLRGSVALDLLPLWLALIVLGAFCWIKRSVGIPLSATEIALLGLIASVGAAWLTGIWTLVRLGPLIGLLSQKVFREEIALTGLTSAEFLEQTLRRRVDDMKAPLIIVVPTGGLCLWIASSAFDYAWRNLGGFFALVYIFVLTSIFFVRTPTWAVANILARLCRGSAGAARRLRLMSLWIMALILVPIAFGPALFIGVEWSLSDFDHFLMYNLDSYHPVLSFAHMIVFAPIFFLEVMALLLLRYRAYPSSVPRRVRGILWFLIPFGTALTISLMSNDHGSPHFVVLAFPLAAIWFLFVRMVVRKSRTSWDLAAERYFKFD